MPLSLPGYSSGVDLFDEDSVTECSSDEGDLGETNSSTSDGVYSPDFMKDAAPWQLLLDRTLKAIRHELDEEKKYRRQLELKFEAVVEQNEMLRKEREEIRVRDSEVSELKKRCEAVLARNEALQRELADEKRSHRETAEKLRKVAADRDELLERITLLERYQGISGAFRKLKDKLCEIIGL